MRRHGRVAVEQHARPTHRSIVGELLVPVVFKEGFQRDLELKLGEVDAQADVNAGVVTRSRVTRRSDRGVDALATLPGIGAKLG